jgi:hypothetical protein
MKRCIVLLMSLLLLGCASVPPPPVVSAAVFDDALFQPLARPPDARTLFELTPAMRRHLVERIEPQVRRHGAPRALLDALYTQGDLRLEYESLHTRTAAEAFDDRRGNCLSLVLMTAAFARELGLPVRFHEVLGTPVVERNGVLTFVVGHVNPGAGRDHLRHRGGELLAVGHVQELVGPVGVALRAQHAADHHLRLREALLQHAHQRDRAALADVAQRRAEVRLRRGVQRLLQPGRQLRARSSRWRPARRRGRRGGR